MTAYLSARPSPASAAYNMANFLLTLALPAYVVGGTPPGVPRGVGNA